MSLEQRGPGRKGTGESARPRGFCLISGPPRSGTTALARWLGEQPGVVSVEETRILIGAHRFLEEALRFRRLADDRKLVSDLLCDLVHGYYRCSLDLQGATLLVDKEPLEPIAFPDRRYTEFLASVRSLLPRAKLLLMIREPLGTIWSMSRRKWGYSLVDEEPIERSLEECAETWNAGVEAVLRYAADPNTYICPFERLTRDPVSESARICDFLAISGGHPFQPRPTKQTGFDDRQGQMILRTTAPQRKALRAQQALGIDY